MCSVFGLDALAESSLLSWVFSCVLLRGVILESNCDGTYSHAFSSRILTTCAGYRSYFSIQ